MKSKHYQLLSITDTWTMTLKIFSEHFLKFLFVTAIPLIISYAFVWSTAGSLIFSLKTLADPKTVFSASSGFFYFAIIAFLIIGITQIWGAIALLVAVIFHKEFKLGEIFYRSLRFFWSFILLSLITLVVVAVFMFLGYLVLFFITVLIGLLNNDLLLTIFNNLNFIPTIAVFLASTFLIFAPYFLIEDKLSAWSAFRKSFRLVRNYFWPVIVRLLIVYAVVYTIMFLITLIPYVGQAIAILLSIPLLAIYTYVIYKNLKPETNNGTRYSQ